MRPPGDSDFDDLSPSRVLWAGLPGGHESQGLGDRAVRDSHAMRARPRVLFRVAAGPRIGFGHLMRCRALARALDVPLVVSLRGGALDASPSRQISGLRLARSIDWKSIDAVVVDDPSAQQASPWLLRARSAGVFTLAVQDLGVSSGPARSPRSTAASRQNRRSSGQRVEDRAS